MLRGGEFRAGRELVLLATALVRAVFVKKEGLLLNQGWDEEYLAREKGVGRQTAPARKAQYGLKHKNRWRDGTERELWES